jgi:cytochrome c556
MAARMSVRSLLATVLATLLLASVVPGADANRNRQKIMHQTAAHAVSGRRRANMC